MRFVVNNPYNKTQFYRRKNCRIFNFRKWVINCSLICRFESFNYRHSDINRVISTGMAGNTSGEQFAIIIRSLSNGSNWNRSIVVLDAISTNLARISIFTLFIWRRKYRALSRFGKGRREGEREKIINAALKSLTRFFHVWRQNSCTSFDDDEPSR